MLLSIVVTAHNENLLLHKTLLSLKNAVEPLDQDDYQIIVHLDNGSATLIDYLENKESRAPIDFVYYLNNFGDLGESRNFCIGKALGEYVYFIDADDLISSNFLEIALKKLSATEEDVLLHPQTCISFKDAGSELSLWRMNAAENYYEDAFAMFERNLWISSVIGRKSIFLKYPYPKTENGFGHEDYSFNISTLNDGIRHDIVEGTVHFYRQKEFSLLRASNSDLLTQRKSDLFDFERWRKMPSRDLYTKHESIPKKVVNVVKKAYVDARNNKAINFIVEPVANAAKRATGKKLIKPLRLHPFELQEWKRISSIETQLYPTDEKLKKISLYDPRVNNLASVAYSKLCDSQIESVDYLFIVPWVATGGADKVLINYLNAIKELWPQKKVGVMTTLESDNAWKNKLPDNTVFIDFGNESKDLEDYEKEILFTRIIVQLGCSKVHIINSEFAYRWVDAHRTYVANNISLYISLFCYDVIPGTGGMGHYDYADPFALNIYNLVDTIYTDNSAIIEALAKKYGFDRNRVIVHYQPSGYSISELNGNMDKGKLNVLWASRICPQKNPELLLEIADHIRGSIHIDAYGKFDPGYSEKFFKGHKNIEYKSSFNGLASIDLDEYDCLLYTSFIDGLPNILLEATACGLPIIASGIGGIGDLVKDHETGILIDRAEDVDSYVEALEFARTHKADMRSYQKEAQELLRKQFSWESYINQIKSTFNIDR